MFRWEWMEEDLELENEFEVADLDCVCVEKDGKGRDDNCKQSNALRLQIVDAGIIMVFLSYFLLFTKIKGKEKEFVRRF